MGEKNERMDEAERLVGEHYADVLRYCRRHAPAGLAEDAAQETFLRFVRARSRYRERGRARAYLVTIARNVCADMARDRGGVLNCIECGTCAYVCPANRALVQSIQMCKQKLREKR